MSNSIVETLREKTEEVDLDQILKSSMGGYTKKSVREYLAQVKRHQQNTAEVFRQNLQSVLTEKENLQTELSVARTRLEKAEADYHNLSQALAACPVDGESSEEVDVAQLQGTITLLEKDMDEAIARIQSDEQELAHRQQQMEQSAELLEQEKQKNRTLQELLKGVRSEGDELRKTVSSQSVQITQLQNEVDYLSEMVTDGRVATLNQRIDSLSHSLRTQQEINETKNQELERIREQLRLLREERDRQRQTNQQLTEALNAQTEQNEKWSAAHAVLSQQLEDAHRRTMELLQARSALQVEKAILARRLDSHNLQQQLEETLTVMVEPAAE